jgi:2-amino-4-hydroxy-6-hydroxymethyldihydropteridine diphosphokinase
VDNHIVYLALGSNLGNREENLKQAISSLSPQMTVKEKSHVYETPPWGHEDQPRFLNQVLKAQTYLQPEQLLKHIKRLELALGRKGTFRNGPREIDIDLLMYDDLVLNTPILALPHPHMHERGFVLLPMMDIAPDLVHPLTRKSVREMLIACNLGGIKQVS